MPSYPLSCQETSSGRDDTCGFPVGPDGTHPGRHSFESESAWTAMESRRVAMEEGSYFDKVAEFHRTAQIASATRPALEDVPQFTLTLDLMEEELDELTQAYVAGDLVEFADAVCDLTYVVLRAGYMAGLPMDRLFNEVHRSNMSKFPNGEVIRRADGKILKPESWTPPQLKEIIDHA